MQDPRECRGPHPRLLLTAGVCDQPSGASLRLLLTAAVCDQRLGVHPDFCPPQVYANSIQASIPTSSTISPRFATTGAWAPQLPALTRGAYYPFTAFRGRPKICPPQVYVIVQACPQDRETRGGKAPIFNRGPKTLSLATTPLGFMRDKGKWEGQRPKSRKAAPLAEG